MTEKELGSRPVRKAFAFPPANSLHLPLPDIGYLLLCKLKTKQNLVAYLSAGYRSVSVNSSGAGSPVWLSRMVAIISRHNLAGGPISRMAGSNDQQVVVGCWWEAIVGGGPLHSPPHTGLLSTFNSITSLFPQNKEPKHKGVRQKVYSLNHLPLEMTKHHVRHVRCQGLSLVHVQGKGS